MKKYFNGLISKSLDLPMIIGFIILGVLILPFLLILILLCCGKPLTEEEKKKFNRDRKPDNTNYLRSHCGCCSGHRFQIS
jgi:hypothetical protein